MTRKLRVYFELAKEIKLECGPLKKGRSQKIANKDKKINTDNKLIDINVMTQLISSTQVNTTCPYCGVGCGIKATVNETDRTINVTGLDHHPANLGRLCSKGSALDQTVSLNERLLEPKINNQVVSWDKALDKVANGFSDIIKKTEKKKSNNSVLLYFLIY